MRSLSKDATCVSCIGKMISLAHAISPALLLKCFSKFLADESYVCPAVTVRHYTERTEPLCKLWPIFSVYIAHCIKTVLAKASIDTCYKRCISIRWCKFSYMYILPTKEILEAANWSTESMFQNSHYKPEKPLATGCSPLFE